MAKFIAVSGPSATGKTSIVNELSTYPELSNVIFVQDFFSTVWYDLVDKQLFSEYEDISRDSEYLCIFIQRVIDAYKQCLDTYANKDALVILDTCWIDISIYSVLNMWYSHLLKDVQESLLKQLSYYEDRISRIYISSFDENKHKVEKYRVPFKRYNVKYNRQLELQYYNLSAHFKTAESLPTTDISEAALFIIEDLKKLGYI